MKNLVSLLVSSICSLNAAAAAESVHFQIEVNGNGSTLCQPGYQADATNFILIDTDRKDMALLYFKAEFCPKLLNGEAVTDAVCVKSRGAKPMVQMARLVKVVDPDISNPHDLVVTEILANDCPK